MLASNWYIIFFTAVIPVIIGYVWYHPKVFGEKLAKISGIPLADIGVANNVKRVLSIYGFSIMVSYMVLVLAVHQIGPHLLFFMEPQMADPNYEAHAFLANFLEQFGDRHRSFGHGVIHGGEMGLMWSIALLGTSAFIEGKPFKNLWIHVGFWILSCSLIGGMMGAFFSFG